mgnify:CR=1 FL=1
MTSEQYPFANILPPWAEELLHTQQTLVLATCKDNAPYCSLMCFLPIPEERALLLVTARESAKYRNMRANSQVSLLLSGEIGLGSGRPSGKAVTFLGRAAEVAQEERGHLESAFADRFPGLASFAQSPDSALIRVRLTAAIASGDVEQARHYQL